MLVAADEDLLDLTSQLGDVCESLTPRDTTSARDLLERNADIAVVLAPATEAGVVMLESARALRPASRRVLILGDVDGEHLLTAYNRARPHHVSRAADAELGAILELLSAEHDARSLRVLRELDGDADGSGKLAHRDSLTGLYNHRSFQERLREELARARRFGQPLCVLYGDLDDFSSLNESAGFELGDEVLERIARVIRSDVGSRVRECDIAARFGGQEFAVLMPETDKAGAEIKADRLRQAIARAQLPGARSTTISFGVAGFPEDATEADPLVRCAASSLRRAKEIGRNCVHVYAQNEGDGPARDVLSVRAESFPTYHNRMGDLVHVLERDRTLSCLYIDLSRLRRIEREFGVVQHTQLFARAGELIASMRGETLRQDDLVCRTDDAGGYLCFVSPPREGATVPIDFDTVMSRVTRVLEDGLADAMRGLTRDLPQVALGKARVLENPMVRGERLIIRLVEEAKQAAALEWEQTAKRNKALLQEIIIGRRLRSVFQPIVDLDSGSIFGYEGLTRGPEGSALESPTALFSVADSVDLTLELDRACFEGALASTRSCEPVHRIFLNLLPQSFYDTSFVSGEVVALLDAASLTPANLVFEITERLAIENFSAFRQALDRYTDMGFGVAVDDVGTRHSNLESVMALRPHFIKLSDILSRGVAQSTVKREMVRSLQRIAETIDAVTVAEGIENTEDLLVLRELGVRFGQGFYLSRPGAGFPVLSNEVQLAMAALPARARGAFIASGDSRGLAGDDDEFFEQTRPQGRSPRGSAVQDAVTDSTWRPLSQDRKGEGDALLDTLRDPDSEPGQGASSGDGFDDEPTRTRGDTPVN